jgi:epsilon-lactone hydrolase
VVGASPERVLLCIHGGGCVSGSIYTHRKMFGHLAKAAGVRMLLVEYRLLPEGGAYPAPVDEVEAAYRCLLCQGSAASYVAFAGGSTGAWLAVTLSRGPAIRVCRCQRRRCYCRRPSTWK